MEAKGDNPCLAGRQAPCLVAGIASADFPPKRVSDPPRRVADKLNASRHGGKQLKIPPPPGGGASFVMRNV